MTYLIDRNHGSRVYRKDENGSFMLDAFQNRWIASEIPADCEEMKESDAIMYEKALAIAYRAHAGQKDKAGADYIIHPVTVSSFVKGPVVSMIAALLHDVAEDTPVTLQDLKNEGFSEEVIACVDSCTHREGEERSVYINRLAENENAIYVKLADLRHNSDLSRLAHVTQKDLYRLEKYRRETEYLKGILERKTK